MQFFVRHIHQGTGYLLVKHCRLKLALACFLLYLVLLSAVLKRGPCSVCFSRLASEAQIFKTINSWGIRGILKWELNSHRNGVKHCCALPCLALACWPIRFGPNSTGYWLFYMQAERCRLMADNLLRICMQAFFFCFCFWLLLLKRKTRCEFVIELSNDVEHHHPVVDYIKNIMQRSWNCFRNFRFQPRSSSSSNNNYNNVATATCRMLHKTM